MWCSNVMLLDNIYIFSQFDCEKFNITTKKWSTFANMPFVALETKQALFHGIFYQLHNNQLYSYNPETDQWSMKEILFAKKNQLMVL